MPMEHTESCLPPHRGFFETERKVGTWFSTSSCPVRSHAPTSPCSILPPLAPPCLPPHQAVSRDFTFPLCLHHIIRELSLHPHGSQEASPDSVIQSRLHQALPSPHEKAEQGAVQTSWEICHFLLFSGTRGTQQRALALLRACLGSHFSPVSPCATLWTAACRDPLSMGFSRQGSWSGLPCPPAGDLSDPGIKSAYLTSPALSGRSFTTSTIWEDRSSPHPS